MERIPVIEDSPQSESRKHRDSSDESIVRKKIAHPEKGAIEVHGETWPPVAPSAPPVTLMAEAEIQKDMQLQKLEFEIKLQKLTNELQELKRVSNTREDNNSETRQSPLERAINQARGEGQDTSEILAFPVLEIEDQDNVIRQYQTLEFKVIKELKLAVAQYGPTAPFTQALLDTVIESNLTPQDWKTRCKATLSGGDFLL